MPTSKNPAYRHLTIPQVIEIGNFLATVCEVTDSAKHICVYAEGWNDAKVAEKFSVGVAHIYGLRLKTRGRVHKLPKPCADVAMLDLVAKLEDRIADLEKWANARPVQSFTINGA